MKLRYFKSLILTSGLMAMCLTGCDLFYKEDKVNGPLKDESSWAQALLFNDIDNFTLSMSIPYLESEGQMEVRIEVTKNKCHRLVGTNEDYLEFNGENCYQYVHDDSGWIKQDYFAIDSDFNMMVFDIKQDWFAFFDHVHDDRALFQYVEAYNVYHAEGIDFEIHDLETTKYYNASFKIYVNRSAKITSISETFYLTEEPTKQSEGQLTLNLLGSTKVTLPEVA